MVVPPVDHPASTGLRIRWGTVALLVVVAAALASCSSRSPQLSSDSRSTVETAASSDPAPSEGTTAPVSPSGSPAEVEACALLHWADFPAGLGADDSSTRRVAPLDSTQYPTACQWDTIGTDELGTPALIKVVVGYLPGATKETTALPEGAHWDVVAGRDRTVKPATLGSGEPTCQTGMFLPELAGRVDMLVINAGAPLLNVCTLATELGARIVDGAS